MVEFLKPKNHPKTPPGKTHNKVGPSFRVEFLPKKNLTTLVERFTLPETNL